MKNNKQSFASEKLYRKTFLKKDNLYSIGEKVGSLGEILGMSTTIVGFFLKSNSLKTVGIAITAFSTAEKLAAKSARAKLHIDLLDFENNLDSYLKENDTQKDASNKTTTSNNEYSFDVGM